MHHQARQRPEPRFSGVQDPIAALARRAPPTAPTG